MLAINKIHLMDCLEGLGQLDSESVQCCVTSPPYWSLRNYEMAGQYGLEPTPERYIQRMVQVFDEVYRVLKPNGTLWLNLGDAYWGSAKVNKGLPGPARGAFDGELMYLQGRVKTKDLIGLPWLLAFALRNQGWYLRQDLIWHKPNPMPESVKDRCTKSHEYIFLLAKSATYYYDHEAIMSPVAESSVQRLRQNIAGQSGSTRVPGKTNGPMKASWSKRKPRPGIDTRGGNQGGNISSVGDERTAAFANKRSVWTIAAKPVKGNHFATFPEELVANCIKAGSKAKDLVLDPFMGSGTSAVVAALLDRAFIGFELNPAYIRMAEQRLRDRLGLFY